MKTTFLFVFISLSHFAKAQNAEPSTTVNGTIQRVTVYQQAAKLSGDARVEVRSGVQEIVVSDLTTTALQQSLQVKLGNSGVELLSAVYRTNTIKLQKTQGREKFLKDSTEILNDAIGILQQQTNTNNEEMQLIRNSANRLGTDKGVTTDEVTRMGDLFQKRLNDLHLSSLKISKQMTKLNAILSVYNGELYNNDSKTSQNVGEIVLKVKAKSAGSTDIAFSFLTQNARWVPLYDLRAAESNKPLQLTYKANVLQTTGFDWKNVKISVSTGNPSSDNTLPIFKSNFVDLVPKPIVYKVKEVTVYTEKPKSVTKQTQEEMQKGVDADGVAEVLDKEYNTPSPYPIDTQGRALDNNDEPLTAPGYPLDPYKFATKIPTNLYQLPPTTEGGVAVELDLKDLHDIPSSGEAHLIQIEQYDIAALYQYFTIPKREPAAFLLAKIANFGQYNLVRGAANLFYNDTYIGQSVLDPNITSDTLALSMGRDEKVSISREKLKDFTNSKVLSTSKKETLGYEISVRNNKNLPIEIEIIDNVPVSKNENVVVEIDEKSGALYDATYGKLTWKLSLKAGETRKLKLVYTLKYPKTERIKQ
jgi:Domain of unknown function (DUF4139)/N-terminal domain of unknown function (DUF4140)